MILCDEHRIAAPSRGIADALVDFVVDAARRAGCAAIFILLTACAASPPPSTGTGGIALRSRFLAGHGALAIETHAAPLPAARREGDRIAVTLSGVAEPTLREALAGTPLPFVAGAESHSTRDGSLLALTLPAPAGRIQTSTRREDTDGAQRLVIEFVDTAADPGREARLRAALAATSRETLAPCALVSERMLRGQIGAERITHRLGPDAGPYAALVALGLERAAELARFDTLYLDGPDGPEPIDLVGSDGLDRARGRAGEVRGLLLLLRAAVEALEPDALHEAALRGLLAPDLSAERFGTVLRNADHAAALCADFGGRHTKPEGPDEGVP